MRLMFAGALFVLSQSSLLSSLAIQNTKLPVFGAVM